MGMSEKVCSPTGVNGTLYVLLRVAEKLERSQENPAFRSLVGMS